MKRIYKLLTVLSVIVCLILAGFFVYDRWIKPERLELEIKKIDTTQLTTLPKIHGLSASFYFNDSLVTNLWRVKYVLTNIGSKTIVGEGSLKTVIGDNLRLKFKNPVSIYNIQISNENFPISLKGDKFLFKQWRATEYVEIIAFVESKGKSAPEIQLDERDLIDGRITYTTFVTNDNLNETKLIDYMPDWLKSALKWIITFVIVFSFFGLFWTVREQQKKDGTGKDSSTKIITVIIVVVFWLIFATPLLWIF